MYIILFDSCINMYKNLNIAVYCKFTKLGCFGIGFHQVLVPSFHNLIALFHWHLTHVQARAKFSFMPDFGSLRYSFPCLKAIGIWCGFSCVTTMLY